MIRLTRHSDYGVLILVQLAQHGHESDPISARNLAEATGLPLPMVSKILKLLAGEDLLTSHRGIKGGYLLARPPELISIARVIEVLEGPIALTECIEGAPGSCDLESLCNVRGVWQRINIVIRRALEEVTLADMLAPLHESSLPWSHVEPAAATPPHHKELP